ncbi:MAG: CheR family methyltransferase [Chloroflexota bacterium]
MTNERDGEGWLVVVGASAGGIEAIISLISPLPKDFPAPIVIAQHLQSSRPSHLKEILAGRSSLAVRTVEDREPLEPGVIYVVPADNHVRITDHDVAIEGSESDRPAPSIDLLLSSAAEIFGDRLVAVILSGMGTDGTDGARVVKIHGGSVVIQNPETAPHPGMPRAVPPTIVDFVADADRIGELLVELVTGNVLVASTTDDDRLLRAFLDQLRERTGIDFSTYKRPTVLRRLQRRMVATGNARLRDYVLYTQKHPEEFGRVTSAFLIKVTEFFRDTDLYEHLRESLLPALISAAQAGSRELRIWSAGCATGEEPYSLAILVSEALGSALDGFSVRIFATDLDEDAVAFARRGIYPPSALAPVPPELLDRYFMKEGLEYEVTKKIRSLVVFGQHDLGQRAPFPRIDLALCRNVLIYFTPELQKRALQLFAFSLRDGGYLVLGKAESTTPFAEHFVLENPRLKVYRRAGERVLIPPARIYDTTPVAPGVRLPTSRRDHDPGWTSPANRGVREPARTSVLDRQDQVLLRLPVGVVVVNRDYDIVLLNAAARRLLGVHRPAIGADLIHLIQHIATDELRASIDAALAGEARDLELNVAGSEIADDGDETSLLLSVQPYRAEEGAAIEAAVIAITDVTGPVTELRDASRELARTRGDLGRLTDRLERARRTQRELESANEELSNANATYRTANEELLLANEEVQAATEEVETLNEELQATNEELETLNEELQATVEELNTTNDDLESRSAELHETTASLQQQRQRSEQERSRLALILDSMNDAVLVVDTTGTTVMTNRAYQEMFGSRTWVPRDDAGRPLPPEEWPQARAGRGEAFGITFNVPDTEVGLRNLEATCQGFTTDGWGGVVVMRDITDRSLRRLQERFIAAASHELRTPTAALHGFLQLLARRLPEDLDPTTSRYLEQATLETRRLGDLVERLFDVSLVQRGGVAIRPEKLDLVPLVAEAVELAHVLAPSVRINDTTAVRTLKIRADPLRLRQVVLNVLGNAITHGAGDTGEVEVRVEQEADNARVVVEDRGPGIPPDIRPRLFAPFSASDGSDGDGTGDPRMGVGLGLGLYLSREIMQAHGGTIEAAERPGGGTAVTISLPVGARRRAAA